MSRFALFFLGVPICVGAFSGLYYWFPTIPVLSAEPTGL